MLWPVNRHCFPVMSQFARINTPTFGPSLTEGLNQCGPSSKRVFPPLALNITDIGVRLCPTGCTVN